MSNNNCQLCSSKHYKVLYKKKYFNSPQKEHFSVTNVKFGKHGKIVKCSDCGLVYTYDSYLVPTIQKYYAEMNDSEYLSESEGRSKTYHRLFDSLEKIGIAGGKLLDVGCGYGILLKIAKERNWDVAGVEPSKHARDFIMRVFEIQEVVRDAYDLNDCGACFDIVTMIDVIEHLAEPKKMLDTVQKLIKKSGILYLTTPNINSLI